MIKSDFVVGKKSCKKKNICYFLIYIYVYYCLTLHTCKKIMRQPNFYFNIILETLNDLFDNCEEII